MMDEKRQKLEYYASLLFLLESRNLLSISLHIAFRENIKRGTGVTEAELNNAYSYAEENVDLDNSDIHVNWK